MKVLNMVVECNDSIILANFIFMHQSVYIWLGELGVIDDFRDVWEMRMMVMRIKEITLRIED